MPKKKSLENITERTAKNIVGSPFQFVKGSSKSATSKANPLNKPINQDVSDSGVESLKLANKTIKGTKNAVKTADKTIKTTSRTIKTTVRIAGTAAKKTYRASVATINTTVKVVRVATTAATHIVATIMNPIVLILILFILLIFIIYSMIGAASGIAVTTLLGEQYITVAGLKNYSNEYNAAIEFFNTAVEDNRNGFYAIIDNLYYDYNDLTYSDLIYMEKQSDRSQTIYEKSFATDEEKDILKSAWRMPLSDKEALAIAYVYLQKDYNEENGTSLEVYSVTFTQEVIDMIVATSVSYTETTYANQECPGKVCTAVYYDNPDYQPAWDNVNNSAVAYNDWIVIAEYIARFNRIHDGTAQRIYWENNIQWRIDNWLLVFSDLINVTPYYTNDGYDFLDYLGYLYEYFNEILENTPEQIVEEECVYEHTLHSVGLKMNSKEIVMNALGFIDEEKEWVDLTIAGFEANETV